MVRFQSKVGGTLAGAVESVQHFTHEVVGLVVVGPRYNAVVDVCSHKDSVYIAPSYPAFWKPWPSSHLDHMTCRHLPECGMPYRGFRMSQDLINHI